MTENNGNMWEMILRNKYEWQSVIVGARIGFAMVNTLLQLNTYVSSTEICVNMLQFLKPGNTVGYTNKLVNTVQCGSARS